MSWFKWFPIFCLFLILFAGHAICWRIIVGFLLCRPFCFSYFHCFLMFYWDWPMSVCYGADCFIASALWVWLPVVLLSVCLWCFSYLLLGIYGVLLCWFHVFILKSPVLCFNWVFCVILLCFPCFLILFCICVFFSVSVSCIM